MQIDQLRLRISDIDLEEVMPYLPLHDIPVEDLAIAITPSGLAVTGKYRQRFALGFEALVKIAANGVTLAVELADLKAVGPLGGMLKGIVARMIAAKLGRYPGVAPSPRGVILQVNTVLDALGLQSRVKEVRCSTAEGELMIDCSGSIVLTDAERLKSRRQL